MVEIVSHETMEEKRLVFPPRGLSFPEDLKIKTEINKIVSLSFGVCIFISYLSVKLCEENSFYSNIHS